jgi:hypothetical protein
MSTDLDKWQSQLDIFEIDVKKLKQMYQDSNQKLEELENLKQKFADSLLKNQLPEYQERKLNFINKEFSINSKYILNLLKILFSLIFIIKVSLFYNLK